MSTSSAGSRDRTADIPAAGPVRHVTPVQHRGRPIGAFVVDAGSVRFVPVVDLNRLVLGGLGCAAAIAVAVATALGRRRVGIGTVTMGPGGWISLKNATAAGLRPARHRPWWARLLRAHRLVVEHR